MLYKYIVEGSLTATDNWCNRNGLLEHSWQQLNIEYIFILAICLSFKYWWLDMDLPVNMPCSRSLASILAQWESTVDPFRLLWYESYQVSMKINNNETILEFTSTNVCLLFLTILRSPNKKKTNSIIEFFCLSNGFKAEVSWLKVQNFCMQACQFQPFLCDFLFLRSFFTLESRKSQ